MKKKLLFLLLTSFLFSNLTSAQQTIKGRVTDVQSNYIIVGASIGILGTSIGTTSNTEGQFELQYTGAMPVELTVSYLGYTPANVKVTNSDEIIVSLKPSNETLNEIIVTSRRRKEVVQDIPIPISVFTSAQIENSQSFNVNRLKELIPAVQLYSSNPRNTTLNIRGLGSTFGLINDGIDPGVGFYVDGVFYARAAATTLDFIDIEQVEVLRGPQGTLFGKNTTAGAFNISTRKPSFNTGATFETSFGNLGFIQGKATATGTLVKNILAARISFSGTHRDGTIYNTATKKRTNTLNNLGISAQLLFKPSKKTELILRGDFTRQRPDGYAQVFAGVVTTKRAEYRQFESIIKDLNYDLPSRNAFDRKIDHDTPWESGQDMGGVSFNADVELGPGKFTSTTAYRYWHWMPSNDRDFTGLQGLRLSQAPSKHHQFSQEFRYSANFLNNLSGVFGLFALGQILNPADAHTEEAGKDQWRFSQSSTSALWQTPGLLEGYGIKTYPKFRNISGAIFGQLDYAIWKYISIMPGIRINYDWKKVDFSRKTYGGLKTEDPSLIALQKLVYSNQEFVAGADKVNVSGQFTLLGKIHKQVRVFATYSLGFKPIGLNLGGLPTASGEPMVELATVKPELVHHAELGIKSEPVKNFILNATFYNTEIKDYQTQVQTPDLSVNRGYLANAERVRVFGGELEASYRFKKYIQINSALSYTNGRYVKFTNAPVPLEETGGNSFKDISGTRLPGISEWALSAGAESALKGKLIKQTGEYFIGLDLSYRSNFSSSPSESKYLNIDGYALLNGRIGFRAYEGFSIILWARNITNQNYYEMLLPGAGNVGHYAGVLGDPRTFGATLRYTIQ